MLKYMGWDYNSTVAMQSCLVMIQRQEMKVLTPVEQKGWMASFKFIVTATSACQRAQLTLVTRKML